MNYNPSPRSAMVKDPEMVKKHHILVENETLRAHLRLALQEMQVRAANNTDASNFNQCAAAHLRMLGAQDFVEIFLNLVEIEAPAKREATGNLPGNVSQMPKRN